MFLESEDYFMDAETDAAVTEAKSERRYKIVIVSFIVLCFLLIAEFVAYKFVRPSLQSPRVTVSGQKTLTAEEIGMKLIRMSNRNWFTFDVNEAASVLSSEPCIKHVEVIKRFPDKILLNITERIPVAMTFIMDNGKSVPVMIDEDGVLFASSKGNILQSGLPIVSGIPVEYITDGMRVPSVYKTLIEQISTIQSLPQNYFAAVSEICVVPKEYGNYELVLIPSTSHVKVLTDRALNEDALKYMMVVLDVVKKLETEVSEVDLRYGSVSYRAY